MGSEVKIIISLHGLLVKHPKVVDVSQQFYIKNYIKSYALYYYVISILELEKEW
jgi:hypothetical protein